MALKLVRRKKIWYARGTIRGVRYFESTGTSSKEHAEIWRLRREQEILDREYLGEERTSTFAEAVLVYLEKGGEKRYLAPLTRRWGDKILSKITPSEVSRASRELFPDCQASTIRRQLYTPLNAVLRAAHRAKMAPLMHFDPPKVKRKPVVYADDRWFELFFAEAHFQIAAIVLLLTNGGVRVTEACRLRPEDVLEDTSEVILRKTKTGRSRRVAIDDVTMAAIKTAIATCAKTIEGETRVFGYAGRWTVNQAIERVCDRINRKAGVLELRRIEDPVTGKVRVERVETGPQVIRYLSSHKVGRHAFAARLLAKGKSLKLVKDAGDWASIQIVADVYGHLERAETDRAVRESGVAPKALQAPKQRKNAEISGANVVHTRKRPAEGRG